MQGLFFFSVFYGASREEADQAFFKWVFFDDSNKDAICIAHNGGKFDTYFALEYLVNNGFKVDNPLMNGNKIISLTGGKTNATFKDSCLFFPASVAELPEMFGFENKAAKGYFPHKFSSQDNLYAELGELPGKEFYPTEKMSARARAEFDKWHAENRGQNFDFKKTAIQYCTDDVIVLAHAVSIFRSEIEEVSGIDPWYSVFTLAGLAKKIFSSPNFRGENPEPIGIIPAAGYSPGHRQNSKEALIYLDWLKQTLPDLRTAFHAQGEFKVSSDVH